MFLKYFPTPLMDEIDASGGATGESVTPNNTDTTGTGATPGVADSVPDGNKPDAAWAELRRKAELADGLLKENGEYKSKFEKLAQKALPEGFATVDEYLEYLENMNMESAEQPSTQKPAIDEKKIFDVLSKQIDTKVSEHPLIKAAEKERQDRFLVTSFKEAQKVFKDIQKAEDIPEEVWKAWDEGKSKRTLLSHLKEHRYDSDVESARKSGENKATATVMSTAHTAQVNGANKPAEYDNVIVPEAVRRNLELVGVKDPLQQKMAYVKYHR
jgi:hypothetical protein